MERVKQCWNPGNLADDLMRASKLLGASMTIDGKISATYNLARQRSSTALTRRWP